MERDSTNGPMVVLTPDNIRTTRRRDSAYTPGPTESSIKDTGATAYKMDLAVLLTPKANPASADGKKERDWSGSKNRMNKQP